MGLGCARSEWDDFEWFTLPPGDDDAERVWVDGAAVRVLLCDLDNLRADPRRLATRMQAAVALARESDVCAFAGQTDAVGRCLDLVAEFRADVTAVGAGRDAADHALLDAADAAAARHVQFVVMSNDGIFARLALRGALTVVSPSPSKVSSRLVKAARAVFDVDELPMPDDAEAVA